ncbi:ATP-independent periplasmic protein-refolding chaperone Spy [Enterobacteriaceae bacterium ESL0689]|nr:ATP-independent periplasmic protein-refolding chaperone Spy [Enterobacteriaceae bacterium ESL0689]
MKKITALFFASTLALGMTGYAHAVDGDTPHIKKDSMERYHKGMHGHSIHMALKNIKLTDEQKKQIHDIVKNQDEKNPQPAEEDLRAMHDLITSDTFDQAKAEAQIDKIAAWHKAALLQRLQVQNKIYNILTPEQKKKFSDNLNKKMTELEKRAAVRK